jgi:hypothetical protein
MMLKQYRKTYTQHLFALPDLFSSDFPRASDQILTVVYQPADLALVQL